MAHRLSRTSRARAIRNVRVGKHRGGTMDMATLRPKRRPQSLQTAQKPQQVGPGVYPGRLLRALCWDDKIKKYYSC